MKLWKFPLLALATFVFATGCAQDVEDIDRTQPNALKKSDFEGVWYMRQTIVDVPGTVAGPFVGIASSMEKIRWEVQRDNLIAYRAYQRIPGYDQAAGDKENGVTVYADGHQTGKTGEYKEEPIAIFPIVSHFDIQRSYNPSTGEQSNVIVENASDREWDDREYMRVEWSANRMTLSYPDFLSKIADSNFYVGENEDSVDGFYKERTEIDGENALGYFDFTQRVAVSGGEIRLRNSFSRLEDYERDYEPAFYDDNMMTKFGYFRTERLVYDRSLGFTDDSIIYLANRHDMWKNDFKRDENGEYLRDAQDRRIPVPMAQREPKPVVYYLSPNFPEDILEGAMGVTEDWNRAFSRAAAAAKGMTVEELNDTYGPMFVLCKNPVAEDDHEACDPRSESLKEAQDNQPYSARPGDLRHSFIFWVHQPQANGPLGYGPSYPDPETGEIVSGTAYVYGAGVDRVAGNGVDVVRMVNGDFSEDEVKEGVDIASRVLQVRDEDIDPRADVAPELRNVPLAGGEFEDFLLPDKHREVLDRLELDGLEDLRTDATRQQRLKTRLKDSGLDQLLIDDEFIRGLSNGKLDPSKMNDDDIAEFMKDKNPADLEKIIEEEKKRIDLFAENSVYLEEFADDAVIGTALRYKGQDYEEIWQSLRNEVFRAVMAHEVGHTIGLRHNFQASYDSINYFDDYWDLRKENFRVPEMGADLYDVNRRTEKQIEGDMTRYQYSSIMDYHSRFNSDISGIGKYDEAAIVFAYTFGTYEDLDASNEAPILAEPGYVETFEDDVLPESAKRIFHQYDDRFAPTQHPLSDYHYTTIVDMMGGPDALTKRSLRRYTELLDARESQEKLIDEWRDRGTPFGNAADPGTLGAFCSSNSECGDGLSCWSEGQENPFCYLDPGNRPTEVQYMFCSDEWAGAAISCSRWDLGADPFEKVQAAVDLYEEYYPVRNFRRNRLSFGIGSVLNASYRAMSVMPEVYQRYFYQRFYGQDDPTLSNYFLVAAYSGFNFLVDVMTRPAYGAYRYSADEDYYYLVSTDPDANLSNGAADLKVYPGEGRRQYSQYDYGSGYYYFSRLTEIGHYWDQRVALQMLAASSTTTFLGVDTTADFQTYLLPYYLMFDAELTSLFNGTFRRNYDDIAPISDGNGRLVTRNLANLRLGETTIDPLTGSPVANPQQGSSAPVRIPISFSHKLNTMINGVLYFTASTYSQDYVNQARLFRVGTGMQITPLNPETCASLGIEAQCDGSKEVYAYVDRESGIAYGTVRPVGGAQNPGMAEEMIARANVYQNQADTLPAELQQLETAYNQATSDAQRNQIAAEYNQKYNELQSALRELSNLEEDMIMLIETIDVLGNVLF